MFNVMFFVNSALLGVGLAMDAFSVSLANGLSEPNMKKERMCAVAGVFSLFQMAMPLIGWFCVHTFLSFFNSFEKFIPWIALFLLLFIGGKMLLEALLKKDEEQEIVKVGIVALLVQGVATSIDALSVGFKIADYNPTMAVVASAVIGAVTFFICFAGFALGKKFGMHLSNKAGILGGVILILIGVEIFVTGVF